MKRNFESFSSTDYNKEAILSLKVPNFSEFRFLSDAFLSQRIPPVFISRHDNQEVLYIHKTWTYLLALSLFRTESLNVLCRESKRFRYLNNLSSHKREKRARKRFTVYKKLRTIVEYKTPFSALYERMGSQRFIDVVLNRCIAYKVLKRMLFYFRRLPQGEEKAKRIYEYLTIQYPKIQLLYPQNRKSRKSIRLAPVCNTYSGVMSTEEFQRLKERHRFSNSRYFESIFEDEKIDKVALAEAKVQQANLYYEESPTIKTLFDTSELKETKEASDWRNLLLFREFNPDNIERVSVEDRH